MGKVFIVVSICMLFTSSCATVRTHSSLDQDTNKKLSTINGGVMLKINKKRNLPNAFGNADMFGRRVNAGYVELRYKGDLPPENAATSYVIVFNQKEAGDEEKKVRH